MMLFQSFEDYVAGACHEFGSYNVAEDEIVAFATNYDPQFFHLDKEAAKKHAFGGLIASGWHTCAMIMRMMTEHFIAPAASLGSPGVDEVRWLIPVRPGDTLRLRVSILSTRLSVSKPDRGIVYSLIEGLNQNSEVVASLKTTGLFLVKKRLSK
jgi:acyl dehydratase